MRPWALVVLLATSVAAAAVADAEEGRRRPADPERILTKAEIVAARSPDSDHDYSFELEWLVPIERTDLVVTLHRGRGWGDELVVWAKVSGGYRRLRSFVDEAQMGSSYDPVRSFRYGGTVFLVVSYFTGSAVTHATSDTILAVEQYAGMAPTLTEVQVESPERRYRAMLEHGESVQNPVAIELADERLEWSVAIWNVGDGHCCPTAGAIRGTFELCEDRQFDDATKRWTSTWRMTVADAHREAAVRPVPPTHPATIRHGCPPSPVVAGVLLPDAAGRLPGDP